MREHGTDNALYCIVLQSWGEIVHTATIACSDSSAAKRFEAENMGLTQT